MTKLEEIVKSLDRVVMVAVERAENMVLNTYMHKIKNPSKKCFTIIAGIVTSKDGDAHKIGHSKLIQLYKLDPKKCYINKYNNAVM